MKGLTLPINSKQLEELSNNTNSIVYKSYLRIKSTHYIQNHIQAITKLQQLKQWIQKQINEEYCQQNFKKYYRKIIIQIYMNIICREFCLKQFQVCLKKFNQLIQFVQSIQQVREILAHLLQVNSLVSLNNYKMHCNEEYKYPPQIQAEFFYILGKIKMASNKTQEAKMAFEKVLSFKNTIQINQYMKIRIYDYLTEMKIVGYMNQSLKMKKNIEESKLVSLKQKQCCSQIIKQLINKQDLLRHQISNYEQNNKDLSIKKKIFISYLNYQKQHFQNNKYQDFIYTFKKQNNPIIIKQVLENSVAIKAQQFYKTKIKTVSAIMIMFYIRKILTYYSNQRQSSLNPIQQSQPNIKKSNKPLISTVKQSKTIQNKQVVLKTKLKKPKLQITATFRKYIQQLQIKDERVIPYDTNIAIQILKKCEQGSYLLKINFSNSQIKKKFVKIGQKQLLWSDNQKDINDGSKIKWKNILGVVYGKVSHNLAKKKFQNIQPWKCFSLITQDRSFDFCCEQQQDIYLWLQGLSYKLQIHHKNPKLYPFYSKGRALWKLILLKMNIRYKKNNTKKYNIQNAGAVLSFNSRNQTTSQKSKNKTNKSKYQSGI